jgi:hypothetical protein
MGGMDELRQQPRRHPGEAAGREAGDAGPALGRLFGRVGRGGGVEERDAGDPVGHRAEQLEGDIAPHRQGDDDEAAGRGLRRAARHRRDAVVAGQVGHDRGDDVAQVLDLMRPQFGVAQQAGQEKDGRACRRGHGHLRLVSGMI